MPTQELVDELFVLLFLKCSSKGCAGFFEPAEQFDPVSMETWSERMAIEAERNGWRYFQTTNIVCPSCAPKCSFIRQAAQKLTAAVSLRKIKPRQTKESTNERH